MTADKFSPEEHQAFVDHKRRNRMAEIDRLPANVRALIHEYSYAVVKSFMDCGMKNPNHIRHCVERVLDEFSPTRGSYSKQGKRTEVERSDEPAAR